MGSSSLAGCALATLLAVLLLATTPVGTGGGVHQFDLVHPLFSHVHIINGRTLTHEQMRSGDPSVSRAAPIGSSVGAPTSASAADGDLGPIATDLPLEPLLLRVEWDGRLADWRRHPTSERREAPPDPPPTLAVSLSRG
jgi:hypothetical protein